MADNKINVSRKSTNGISVRVRSDNTEKYSKLAKEWAISDELVENEDYSSKFYANKSKEISETAEENLNEISLKAQADIDATSVTAIEDINNSISEAKTDLGGS